MIKHINLLIRLSVAVFLILLLITVTVKMRNDNMPSKVVKAYVIEPNLKAELSEKKAIIVALTERNDALTKDAEKRIADILELQKKFIANNKRIEEMKIETEFKVLSTNLVSKHDFVFCEGQHRASQTISVDQSWKTEAIENYSPIYYFQFYIDANDIKIQEENGNFRIRLSREQIKLKPLARVNEAETVTVIKKNKFFSSDITSQQFDMALKNIEAKSRAYLIKGDEIIDGKTLKNLREGKALKEVMLWVTDFGYDNVIVEFID